MKPRTWLAALPLVFVLVACGSAASPPPQELTPVRLPMGYIPNVQFAPVYVAIENGYFAEEGILIEPDYSFETDGITLVGGGDLQFSLASGEQVLLARSRGLPVVYVLAWWREFPVAIAASAESGIRTPADLIGKEVGIPLYGGASFVGYQAILRAANVPADQVNLKLIGFHQVESLYSGLVQAAVVYAVNEPVQLEAMGFPTTVIAVKDYVSLASNGLISNQATIDQNPALVRGMVRAFLRGLADTIEDPERAFEICRKYVEGLTADTEAVQREVLARSIEYWRSSSPGYSDGQAWENMHQVLLNIGLLDQAVDVSQAYTNEFIP